TGGSGTPAARASHSAVWTGSLMVIWGGLSSCTPNTTKSGSTYTPANSSGGSWTALTTTGAPTDREQATAVWTGSKMIVWGGFSYSLNSEVATGGLLDPTGSGTWTSTSTSNNPSARHVHSAVWTGSKMIVWGGGTSSGSAPFNSGA